MDLSASTGSYFQNELLAGRDYSPRDHPHYYEVNVVFLQNAYVESLISKVMVFGGGDFSRGLDHEGWALVSGISALIRRDMKDDIFALQMRI